MAINYVRRVPSFETVCKVCDTQVVLIGCFAEILQIWCVAQAVLNIQTALLDAASELSDNCDFLSDTLRLN